jgi:photosystem II stability/assembly factor-like uncharacterized protein
MANQHRILVGTVGEGIFGSDDDGQSFTRKSHGMFVECDVRAIAAHPHEPSVVFAGTNEGLYRSADCGETWTRIDSPMNSMVIWSLLVDPRRPQTMFAGTRPPHVFRSLDSGRTWSLLGVAIERDCANLVFNRVTTLMADHDSDTFWMGVDLGFCTSPVRCEACTGI